MQGPAAEVAALNAYIKLMRAAESGHRPRVHFELSGGLTVSQFGALEVLLHCGSLCQRGAGGQAAEEAPATSPIMVVDNLERRRSSNAKRDRRPGAMSPCTSTAKGRLLIQELFPKVVANITREFSLLTPDEQRTFAKLCKKLRPGACTGGVHHQARSTGRACAFAAGQLTPSAHGCGRTVLPGRPRHSTATGAPNRHRVSAHCKSSALHHITAIASVPATQSRVLHRRARIGACETDGQFRRSGAPTHFYYGDRIRARHAGIDPHLLFHVAGPGPAGGHGGQSCGPTPRSSVGPDSLAFWRGNAFTHHRGGRHKCAQGPFRPGW